MLVVCCDNELQFYFAVARVEWSDEISSCVIAQQIKQIKVDTINCHGSSSCSSAAQALLERNRKPEMPFKKKRNRGRLKPTFAGFSANFCFCLSRMLANKSEQVIALKIEESRATKQRLKRFVIDELIICSFIQLRVVGVQGLPKFTLHHFIVSFRFTLDFRMKRTDDGSWNRQPFMERRFEKWGLRFPLRPIIPKSFLSCHLFLTQKKRKNLTRDDVSEIFSFSVFLSSSESCCVRDARLTTRRRRLCDDCVSRALSSLRVRRSCFFNHSSISRRRTMTSKFRSPWDIKQFLNRFMLFFGARDREQEEASSENLRRVEVKIGLNFGLMKVFSPSSRDYYRSPYETQTRRRTWDDGFTRVRAIDGWVSMPNGLGSTRFFRGLIVQLLQKLNARSSGVHKCFCIQKVVKHEIDRQSLSNLRTRNGVVRRRLKLLSAPCVTQRATNTQVSVTAMLLLLPISN